MERRDFLQGSVDALLALALRGDVAMAVRLLQPGVFGLGTIAVPGNRARELALIAVDAARM